MCIWLICYTRKSSTKTLQTPTHKLHPVKLVAASPKHVAPFLAQSQLLQQGPQKTESSSEVKIHQPIDGRRLKSVT